MGMYLKGLSKVFVWRTFKQQEKSSRSMSYDIYKSYGPSYIQSIFIFYFLD